MAVDAAHTGALQVQPHAGHASPAAAATDASTAAASPTGSPPAAAAAAPTAAAAAHHPSSSSSNPLRHLRHLRCSGVDGPWDTTWCLNWVTSCINLTTLNIRLCSAGEVDCDELAKLQQLQYLSLQYEQDEFVSVAQLGPLTACCKLTQLKLGALLVELPTEYDAAAAAAAAAAVSRQQVQAVRGQHDAVAVQSCIADAQTAAATAVQEMRGPARAAATTAAAGGSVLGQSRPSLMLPQLTSLQRLTAGLMCKAPLELWAPNRTRLRDLDYDLGALDLPSSFIDEQQQEGWEALAGLTGLQVLSANIFALVRHAAHPTNLLGLHELHVDMVGSLEGTCIDPGGLPHLPLLTQLVFYINTKAHRNLARTYTTSEDYLLWCTSHLLLPAFEC